MPFHQSLVMIHNGRLLAALRPDRGQQHHRTDHYVESELVYPTLAHPESILSENLEYHRVMNLPLDTYKLR